MIEAAVKTRVLAAAGVAALVGARMYPTVLPQAATLPAITYQQISDLRYGTFRGPLGLPGTLVQIDVWAADYAGVKEVARQVRLALDGFQGATGGPGGETIQAAILEASSDGYEPDVKVHRVTAEYRIWWNES